MDGDERLQTIARLRSRIAQLGGLQGSGTGAVPRRPDGSIRRAIAVAPASPRDLGFEAEELGCGVAWVRRTSVALAPFLERAGVPAAVTPARLLRLCGHTLPGAPPPSWDEQGIAVLDIESLGLRGSGVVPFLVGLGRPRGDHLEVDQLLLGDPGAEAPLLASLLGRLGSVRALVTYNGRSFDVPVLLARCIVNRLDPGALDAPLPCDVLTPVRRLFRDRLMACSLQRAEVELLGFERDGDVPGFEAPLRYRRWLRGDGAHLLAGVVEHNLQDLCSTLVLAARLSAHLEGEVAAADHPADHYRLAVHLEREGVRERVEDLYRAAMTAGRGPWDRHAAHRLARRLERAGRSPEARALYRLLWRTERFDLLAARRLCIALERDGLVADALDAAAEAEAACAALPAWREVRIRGRPRDGWRAEFARRRARLERRSRRAATVCPGGVPGGRLASPACTPTSAAAAGC